MKGWLALGALIALLAAFGAGYKIGGGHERDANLARKSTNQDKAAVEIDRRAQASANAGMSMLDYLAAQKPAIEIRIHEKINQTRKAYQDNPLPDGCVRPASVRPSLDAARDAANAAARGVRPDPAGPTSAHP